MKTRLHLLTALAVLGTSLASADDERKPEPQPQSPPSESRRPALSRAPMTHPTAFLGVVVSPVPPALAAQLNLPESFGLLVDEVMPDSPAGIAGVQRFDVLRLFNDQQLVDPGQLAALVGALRKDTDITLTLIRKGQEQKLTMKLAGRQMPERRPLFEPGAEMKERMERMKEGFGEGMRKLWEQMGDYEKRMREYHERLKNWRGSPGEDLPKPPELRPSAAPDEITPGSTKTAKVVMKDESGEIEVTARDGHRHLIARDAQGKEVFNGAIDTPEQMKALPEDIRKKVEGVQIQTQSATTAPRSRARLGRGRALE